MLWRKLRQYCVQTGGNVSLVFGLCVIPLTFAVCAAIELFSASNERASLQNAVDAGALAGAARLSVASSTRTDNVSSAAMTVAQQVLTDAHIATRVTFEVTLENNDQAVTVVAHADHKALIGFDGFGNQALNARATAESLNAVPLCILQTGSGGISVRNTARIRATGCAVHANANVAVDSSAMIQADRVQAVGTLSGPIVPTGNAGAMPIDDPFSDMNLNPPKDCAGKAEKVDIRKSGILVLAPGVHCEEIEIDNNAVLQLQPGEHYFMDDLNANDNAVIQGDDVVLVFGSTKKIKFADKAAVRLSARKTGPFAGFLIVTSRDNHEIFTIASDNVSKLLGTIYIPNAELDVDTSGNVAQDSAWSIIVANSLKLTQNPVLVINTGYVGSGVPVPQGVGPGTGAPKLSR